MKRDRCPADAASARSAAVETSLLDRGPVLVALVAAFELMVCFWETFPVREVGQSTRSRLLEYGVGWFYPEYDLPIYALGVLLTIGLAIACGLSWRKRLEPARTVLEQAPLACTGWLQIPVAGGLALLPLLWPGSRLLNFVAAMLGLLFCSLPLLAPGVLKRGIPVWSGDRGAAGRAAEAVFVMLTIGLLVYIPDTGSISRLSCLEDHFHHWDFYAMAPALAYRHGGALGTDHYVQYGVGWPLVLAFLSNFTPLSYKLGVRVGNLWACLYFAALYLLLRRLTGDRRWALPGLLMAILLQMYTGVGQTPKWMWPSSTVMRYPFDVFAFGVCLLLAQNGRAKLGLPLGVFSGLAILFGTDTGIYLLASLFAYFAALHLGRAAGSLPRETRGAAGWTVLGLALVLPAGLAIASRGTLLRSQFWSGWLEVLINYPGGIGQLPIRDAVAEGPAYLLLVLMLLAYLFALLRVLDLLFRRALDARSLTHGVIGLYGLATLMLFIARSHPFNLHHVSIPFCILFVASLASGQRQALGQIEEECSGTTRRVVRAGLELAGLALAGLLFIGLSTNAEARLYPSLLRSLLGAETHPVRVPPQQYLFPSREDVALPPNFQGQIASFQATADAIRSLAQGGRHSVTFIGQLEVACLLEADVGPYFRYCPLLEGMHWTDQLQTIVHALRSKPPDFLLITRENEMGRSDFQVAYKALMEEIQKRYALQRPLGSVDIFQYRPQNQ